MGKEEFSSPKKSSSYCDKLKDLVTAKDQHVTLQNFDQIDLQVVGFQQIPDEIMLQV